MRAEASGRRGVGPPVGPSLARFAASNYLPPQKSVSHDGNELKLSNETCRQSDTDRATNRPATSSGQTRNGAISVVETGRSQRLESRMLLGDLTRISMARLEDMKLLASLTGNEGPLPQHQPAVVEKICLEAEFREEFRRMKELELASRVEALSELGLESLVPKDEADDLKSSLKMYNEYMDAVEQRKTYRVMLGSRPRLPSKKQVIPRATVHERKFALASLAYAPKKNGTIVPQLFGAEIPGARAQARPKTAPVGGVSARRNGKSSHRHSFLSKFVHTQNIISIEVTQRIASVASPRISTTDALGVLEDFITSGRRQFINAIVIARKLYRLECYTPAPFADPGSSNETAHDSIRRDVQEVLSTIEKSVGLSRLRLSVCARIIQAAWLRFVQKRRKVAAKLALMEFRRRNAAAGIVQKMYRLRKAKQAAWNAAVERVTLSACSARIARHWKRWRRRKMLHDVFESGTMKLNPGSQEARLRAAHEIGRFARGFIVRKRLRERQLHVKVSASRKMRRENVLTKFREAHLRAMERINEDIENIWKRAEHRIAQLRYAVDVKVETFEDSFSAYVHNGRIAAQKEPLPRNWLVQMTRDGLLQYINTREGKIQLEHPFVQQFNAFVPVQRARGEEQVRQMIGLVKSEIENIESARQHQLDALFAQLQEIRQEAQEINAPAARGRNLYSVKSV